MPREFYNQISSFLSRNGYVPHDEPLPNDAGRLAFWTQSNKHKGLTPRDLSFLRLYAASALASGGRFCARGIEVEPGRYLRPDRAVMNSCLNAGLVVLDEGTECFEFTTRGLEQVGLWQQ